MKDEPMNDVARWAAMQDAAAAKGAENRAKQREAKPAGALKADGTIHGKGDSSRHGVTNADLDAIHQRRAEGALTSEVRGEMEFARCLGAAPSLVSAMQRLKDDGRA